MHWLFEAYSNVYNLVMMRNIDPMFLASKKENPKQRLRGCLSRRG